MRKVGKNIKFVFLWLRKNKKMKKNEEIRGIKIYNKNKNKNKKSFASNYSLLVIKKFF